MYPRLSPEDEKAFLDSLDSIWNAVGYDCLDATAYEKGLKTKRTDYGSLAPAEQVSLRRNIVVDIVTDQFAGGNHVNLPKEQFNRIRDWMMKTPAQIVDKVVKKRFTYKYYGA